MFPNWLKRVLSIMICICLLLSGSFFIQLFPSLTKAAAAGGIEITQQPVNGVAHEGEPASVTVVAAGEGLTYQWYYKNVGAEEFVHTTTFTGDTYSVEMNADRNGRQIFCRIIDAYGNFVDTDVVTLYIGTPLQILAQPADLIAAEGQYGEISVSAVGDSLTYEWYYKNLGDTEFQLTTTFTGNTYGVEMNADRNGRQVFCRITDQYGVSVDTQPVTLCLNVPLNIVQQPVSTAVTEGQSATVTVIAEGDGLSYQWYFKNAGDAQFSPTASFAGDTYSVEMTPDRSGRQIYCVITDAYGNSVTSDTVTISQSSQLSIVRQPADMMTVPGEIVNVTVDAVGDGLIYEWFYKNLGDADFSLTTTFTGNTYTVEMTPERSGRQIFCRITDAYGNFVSSNTITLTLMEAVQIVEQPVDAVAAEGEMATITVKATGAGLTYAWYYRNPGENQFTLTTTFTGDTYSVDMNSSRAGREVYCVITDAYGNFVSTDIATLMLPEAVRIIEQPVSVTAAEGMPAEVCVKAEGSGLTYQWYYRNTWDAEFILTTTFTSETYSVEMNADRSGRQIYCVITDSFGYSVTTDTVTLYLETPYTDFQYQIINGSVTISGYNGSLTDIVIPSSIEGWAVRAVGSFAFQGCDQLTSIILPDGITSVGNDAFSGCTALTTVNLPSSVLFVGDSAFFGCRSLASIHIPGRVASIGYAAFYDCASLTGVTIDSGVTLIGNYAFSGCRSLTEITLPDTVSSVGSYAFSECTALRVAALPEGISAIGTGAFHACKSLNQIGIPASVYSIDSYAFLACESLQSVAIAPGLNSIGSNAFSGCTALTVITLPSSIGRIEADAFSGCTAMTAAVAANSYAHTWCTDHSIPCNAG